MELIISIRMLSMDSLTLFRFADAGDCLISAIRLC